MSRWLAILGVSLLGGAVGGVGTTLTAHTIKLPAGSTVARLIDSAGNHGPACTDAGTTFNCTVDGSLTVSGALTGAPRPIVALGSGTEIDWSAGDWFTKTTTDAHAFTFANTVDGDCVTFLLTKASGGHDPTWPTVSWVGGVPLDPVATGLYIVTFCDTGSVIVGTYPSAEEAFAAP